MLLCSDFFRAITAAVNRYGNVVNDEASAALETRQRSPKLGLLGGPAEFEIYVASCPETHQSARNFLLTRPRSLASILHAASSLLRRACKGAVQREATRSLGVHTSREHLQ